MWAATTTSSTTPTSRFLFCYGHSVAGQTENYAYVGMYWTWGKDAKDASPDNKKGIGRQSALPRAARQKRAVTD
jgi:hypothetical protein